MPIQRVHVENFKSFSELDVDLSPFNIVIGSNAAGNPISSPFSGSCGTSPLSGSSMPLPSREGQNISGTRRSVRHGISL